MDESYFGYLAIEGFEDRLKDEIDIYESYGRLFLSKTKPKNVFWAQNIWYEPFKKRISSISDGANFLKNIQRNWALYPHLNHRRAHLIEQQLPYISKKPLTFPTPNFQMPLGSWTLIEKDLILASSKCFSFFPNGEPHFKESKDPPSRAYLKLYEIFSILQKMPKYGENCLELGASPGSWSWVLASLGSEVYCIDKAMLSLNLSQFQNIHFKKMDAFSIKKEDFPKLDWFFSDLICYPDKLYNFILKWLDHCDNFICTLKFQGIADRKIIESFSNISGSQIVHLYNNKNELTWVRLKK